MSTGWNKICLHCNKNYISGRPNGKYCSNACRCKAYWPKTKINSQAQNNTFKRLLYSIKSRDEDCILTYQDLEEIFEEQQGLCALTGFPMNKVVNKGKGLNQDTVFNPSVDRINHTLGYIKENIRLVCYQANTMRGVLDDNQMLDWCKAIMTNARKEVARKKKEAAKK